MPYLLYDRFFIDELKNRGDLVRRILLFASLTIVFALTVWGQSIPKAVLLDEFGREPCEFLLARTDAFAAELKSELKSNAFIVIYPPKVRPEFATKQRRLISSTLQLRGLERVGSRFTRAGHRIVATS
jgi:hypothetical protein